MTPKRAYMAAAALLCWFALFLQFYLIIMKAAAEHTGVATAIVNYFSFFTILTNILVALALSNVRFFSRPTVATAVALNIIIVGLTYSLLLRHLWNPQGLQKLADVLLHDVMPVLYVIYWLLFVPKAALQWRNVVPWLTYPLAYMLYTAIRGAITGRYPYAFIDAAALGYPQALLNTTLLLLAFVALGLVLIAIGRRMPLLSASVDRSK